MITVFRGKIDAVDAPHMSGCMTLTIGGKDIVADNAPTVRALEASFGNVIGPGHTFNAKVVIGKEVVYTMDDMGLTLGGIIPYDQWLEDGHPEVPENGKLDIGDSEDDSDDRESAEDKEQAGQQDSQDS